MKLTTDINEKMANIFMKYEGIGVPPGELIRRAIGLFVMMNDIVVNKSGRIFWETKEGGKKEIVFDGFFKEEK